MPALAQKDTEYSVLAMCLFQALRRISSQYDEHLIDKDQNLRKSIIEDVLADSKKEYPNASDSDWKKAFAFIAKNSFAD